MFQVFDNDKETNEHGFPSMRIFGVRERKPFDKFDEAFEHALNWLAPMYIEVDERKLWEAFKNNQPYDYSGKGDLIEIRIVKA